MEKQVMVITGASSGIGAATARRLAQEGVRLTLAARRQERLQEVGKEVERLGSEVMVVPTDVTHRAEIHGMVQATLDRWGRIDVLFNNAGMSYSGQFVDLDPDGMRTEVMVNLMAVIDCAQAVLPTMLRQKSGHIINTASLAGLVALPGSSIYCASKFGVFGFSDALRRELRGAGVHVSTFCPGYTPSELNPPLKAHAEGRPNAPRLPGLMPTAYVADQLARLAYRPRRLVILPKSWRVLILVAYLFPGIADVLVDKF